MPTRRLWMAGFGCRAQNARWRRAFGQTHRLQELYTGIRYRCADIVSGPAADGAGLAGSGFCGRLTATANQKNPIGSRRNSAKRAAPRRGRLRALSCARVAMIRSMAGRAVAGVRSATVWEARVSFMPVIRPGPFLGARCACRNRQRANRRSVPAPRARKSSGFHAHDEGASHRPDWNGVARLVASP